MKDGTTEEEEEEAMKLQTITELLAINKREEDRV